jgi:20S proteasome alpha/beta subunit
MGCSVEDFLYDDRSKFTPSEFHSYLTQLLHTRRGKMKPFALTVFVAGIDKKEPFIYFIYKILLV